jgi:hypothetical protein
MLQHAEMPKFVAHALFCKVDGGWRPIQTGAVARAVALVVCDRCEIGDGGRIAVRWCCDHTGESVRQ